jgi:hypothetical protein
LTGINFSEPRRDDHPVQPSIMVGLPSRAEVLSPEISKIDGRHGRFVPGSRNLYMIRQSPKSVSPEN